MVDRRILCLWCLSFLPIQALIANTVPLFLSVDAMTILTEPGVNQSLNLWNGLGNRYVASKHWSDRATLLFGAGATTYENHHILLNTGVRYFSTSDFLLSGEVWQLHQPQFNNLAYRYRLKSDVVLLENAISYARHAFQPHLIVGVGYAANTASAYQTAPYYAHASSAFMGFTDKKTAQFAYEVGGGMDWNVLKPAMIECAYRFVGAGKAYLGYSPLQNTSSRFAVGNIYYHTISLGIRLYYDHTY